MPWSSNRCVFSNRSNSPRLSHCPILECNEFHRRGPVQPMYVDIDFVLYRVVLSYPKLSTIYQWTGIHLRIGFMSSRFISTVKYAAHSVQLWNICQYFATDTSRSMRKSTQPAPTPRSRTLDGNLISVWKPKPCHNQEFILGRGSHIPFFPFLPSFSPAFPSFFPFLVPFLKCWPPLLR